MSNFSKILVAEEKTSAVNVHDTDFQHEPILAYPDFAKPFTLTTDSSNFALGAVLSQNGHPICFASRTLNEHEIKYSTIEKELLGIVFGTSYFRPYLYGRRFIIQTDHKPLVWLSNLKEPNLKLQRWKLKLDEYNFEVKYIKGKDNYVADALSRIQINALTNLPSSDLPTQHSERHYRSHSNFGKTHKSISKPNYF